MQKHKRILPLLNTLWDLLKTVHIHSHKVGLDRQRRIDTNPYIKCFLELNENECEEQHLEGCSAILAPGCQRDLTVQRTADIARG